MRNKYSAIPECTIDPKSLQNAVMAIKENVEVLTGQRPNSSPPVTWEDLVRLGVVSQQDVPRGQA